MASKQASPEVVESIQTAALECSQIARTLAGLETQGEVQAAARMFALQEETINLTLQDIKNTKGIFAELNRAFDASLRAPVFDMVGDMR
ncbi:hypothetical protein PAPYR_10157 [Paratrimastix pyriformis]|uniref:BLOC-1-related complex subunit 7 n=1 Tax=Paratrimastix pyriformis TaxID=342808 RepID=A0ABQ8UBH4_9EUKA|nr:hypothetical protein PAPYR_10157 [Paratrimastix pyriformis]